MYRPFFEVGVVSMVIAMVLGSVVIVYGTKSTVLDHGEAQCHFVQASHATIADPLTLSGCDGPLAKDADVRSTDGSKHVVSSNLVAAAALQAAVMRDEPTSCHVMRIQQLVWFVGWRPTGKVLLVSPCYIGKPHSTAVVAKGSGFVRTF